MTDEPTGSVRAGSGGEPPVPPRALGIRIGAGQPGPANAITDAPQAGVDLGRIARRAGLGLARTGSVAHHGSGEIFVAFATPAPSAPAADPRPTEPRPSADLLDALFAATVEATEEAVLNALWFAGDVTGRDGRTVHALPRGDVVDILAAHGRLAR